eukprot:761544-Hanusia_phi.AAC.3
MRDVVNEERGENEREGERPGKNRAKVEGGGSREEGGGRRELATGRRGRRTRCFLLSAPPPLLSSHPTTYP